MKTKFTKTEHKKIRAAQKVLEGHSTKNAEFWEAVAAKYKLPNHNQGICSTCEDFCCPSAIRVLERVRKIFAEKDYREPEPYAFWFKCFNSARRKRERVALMLAEVARRKLIMAIKLGTKLKFK